MTTRRQLGLAIAGAGSFAGGVGAVLYQVLKQQGRMMLRIDDLERALQGAVGHHADVPVGLPVGAAIESLKLPDLDGREVALDRFRGRKLLLVSWSPTCGFCEMITPDLARLTPELQRAGTELVFLAQGDAPANRALAERHGLTAPVLLAGEKAGAVGFQGFGTPSAVLIDEHGKVASSVVVGADQVVPFGEEAAAPASNGNSKRLRGQRGVEGSRLVRDGLKAGTPAPPFSLPDLDGNEVSLDAFRGRRVVVVFTDPHCGPCDALAPALVGAQDDQRALILVGRGEVEENRRKAETFGFDFPVVVQDGWKLSRAYGIFETPVAFLVDEEGTIARDVARGADEILALLKAG